MVVSRVKTFANRAVRAVTTGLCDRRGESALSSSETVEFPRWGWPAMLAASALYVCFSLHLPVDMLPNAGADDGWFFEKARTLVAGHWFGPYSEMTLIKGPGYTFFLALNYLLGVSIILSQALLYAIACGLFSQAVFRLTRSFPLSLTLFLLMLWHPGTFALRVIRDDIYGAQSLIYLACLIHVLLLPHAARVRLYWAIAAGLSLGWLWMTREEGVWVLPATVILCAVRAWQDRERLRSVAVFVGTAVLAWTVVASCNLIAYHTFTVVEFKSRAFTQVLGALQSVRVGEPVAFVPAPEKVRQQIYAVSPTFASLKPFFEGSGRGWTQFGCQIYPSSCGDYAAGWFLWALRDAAAQTGHYHSPAAAKAFYNQITAEVKAGCRSGRLHCVSGLVSYVPAVTPSQRRLIPAKLHELTNLLLTQTPVPVSTQSWGTALQLAAMSDFDGYPRRGPAASDPPASLIGWYYSKSNAWLQLSCTIDGQTSVVALARLPSPDIAAHFNDPAATDRRFSTEIPFGANCSLQPAGASPSDARLSFDKLVGSRNQTLGAGHLFIDSYGNWAQAAVNQYAQKALRALSGLYKLIVPLLAIGAGLAYLANLVLLVRGVSRADGYWLLCHMLWLSIACRLFILLLVDISSFPGISMLYVAATLPLVCAALLMTLYLPFRHLGLLQRATPSDTQ